MEEQQTQQPQEPVMLVLNLNLDQVTALISCLDEVPTKFNAWPLKQIVIQQANAQLQQLNQQAEATPESPSTVQ